MVMLAVVAAFGATLCSGVAAILQARVVGRPEVASRLGVSFVARLARSRTYVAALALVGLGLLLSLLALRQLPVFVVAVARAGSLGVTALLAWPLLGVRLRRREVAALVALGIGLVLVVSAAQAGPAAVIGPGLRPGLLGALVLVVALAFVVERWHGPRAGVALAAVAGVDFGLVGVAARVVSTVELAQLPTDLAAWTLAAAGLHGLLTYAAALQRSTVTSATAAMVGVETLSAAVAGTLLLGDSPRPGWALAAAGGFLLAVAGAVTLAGSEATRVTHSAAPTSP